MAEQYENDFLVFDVTDGPKAMIDALNTRGEEGWQGFTSIVVYTKIVVLIKRNYGTPPEPVNEKKEDLVKLWGGKHG